MPLSTILGTDNSNVDGLSATPHSVHFYTMGEPHRLFDLIDQKRKDMGLSQADVASRAFGRSDTSPIQNLRRGEACLMFFSGFHVKREPLPGTLYMPVSGGGWIVLGLAFKDRFAV